MTAQELLKMQLDDAGFQLTKSVEGLSEQGMDHRTTRDAMSPREALEHLGEAYEAFLVKSEGRDYEWGTYKIEDKSTPSLLKAFQEQREKAVNAALSTDDPEKVRSAHMFILGHDYYHVGQICQARLAAEPGWNPYAIYPG